MASWRASAGACGGAGADAGPTVDDGPHPYWTPEVLGVLAEFEVPATFNMIGGQVPDGGGDRSQTVTALRSVLPALKRRGLTFVAL